MSVFDLPMTARPGKDAIAGQDELGRTVYRTVTGERYTMPERTEMPAPTMGQRFENLGGLASRAYEGLSVQGAIEAAKGIGEGIISGIVQGFTAPGRALSGEPVSYGDVLATAGMAQVGAAPMRAPAGSLRSGAMGGGRPPVTFDDVARAMDEGAPAPSPSFTLYQGSPHNFAAERLVRMPDGSTQYIVGAPDVLPDVPAGAEVLQDFPLGRQRSDKIGTGEGAQAYGYGLYGAEAEGVARGYRDALSGGRRGVDAPRFKSINGPLRFVGPDDAHDIAEGGMPALNARIAKVQEDMATLEKQRGFYGDEQVNDALRYFQNEASELEALKATGDVTPMTGSMYEMQINADPEAFLDWDKPLSEQPDLARKLGFEDPEIIESKRNEALNAFNRTTDPNRTDEDYFFGELTPAEKTAAEEMARLSKIQSWGSLKPEDIMKGRRADLNGGRAAVAAAARDKGIPGIKYFDAGSRGADAGTRNYVIFDENLISIVRKYGIVGAAAMLGVSAIDVEQALADNLPQDQWESLVVGK